jgi:hypothetical protein
MESTGIYWVQLFLMLQEYGFDVILVNARHIKNIGEKKTDVVDAHWIMMLHSYGLLRPSYQPDLHTRDLREFMRQRDTLIKSASREVLHIQKALEQMNIKVHKVISDITGKSGMAIVGAILQGERDPIKLAELADKRIEATKEEMIMSLEGMWQNSQLFILQQSYDSYYFYKSRIEQCDSKIEEHLNLLQPIANPEPEPTGASTNQKKKNIRPKQKKCQKNKLLFSAHQHLINAFGVDVTQIPGFNTLSVTKLLGELGPLFYEEFEEAKNFCSWANVVPNNKISGGRLLSSKVPKKKNKVGQIFRIAANTLNRSKCPIGDYFRKIRARRSYGQAVVAVANKLARIFYTMVKQQQEYNEELMKIKDDKFLIRQIINARKRLQMLENQLAA